LRQADSMRRRQAKRQALSGEGSDSAATRLRCREIGFGFLAGACSRLMESVLTFDKSQHHKLDSAVPQRSARRPDRVRPRPDRPDRAAGARRIASVVPGSMLRIRCMTTVLSVTCRTTPRSWGRTGGHGSADPGLGMNRAPDRLYPAVWLSCVRVGCGLAGNDVVCFP
jgi:hypothetical protein